MTSYKCEEAAERVGVEPSYLDRLVELGILAPAEPDRFSRGDVRRVLMAGRSRSRDPARSLGAAIQRGTLSLAFIDAAAYERFAALAAETFRQVSDRTGIPLELLTSSGRRSAWSHPRPTIVREDEMAIVPFIEMQLAEGFRPIAIERLLRVQGDSIRRIAEHEAAWWHSEVSLRPWPRAKAGGDRERRGLRRSSPLAEQALLAMYTRSRRAPGRPTSSRLRGDDGAGGDPQPPRTAAGDLLPRHHRLHAADPGARRRRGGRPRRDRCATRATQLGGARRQAHQVARRRGDVPLP